MNKGPVRRAVVVGALLAGIALLGALLQPALIFSRPGPREPQARALVKAIENALRFYRDDYNKFPEYGSAHLQSTGAGQTDADLTVTLRGDNTNAEVNPRGTVYLGVNEKSLGTNVVTATGGQGVPGAMYDPWGNLYQVAVDHQSSNTVAHADGETLSNRTVAVWSWGPHKTAKPDPNDTTHIRSWK